MRWIVLLVAMAGCGIDRDNPNGCGRTTISCGGKKECVDPLEDPRHCGGCDGFCGYPHKCVNGECARADLFF